jgi:hypothetical protein
VLTLSIHWPLAGTSLFWLMINYTRLLRLLQLFRN